MSDNTPEKKDETTEKPAEQKVEESVEQKPEEKAEEVVEETTKETAEEKAPEAAADEKSEETPAEEKAEEAVEEEEPGEPVEDEEKIAEQEEMAKQQAEEEAMAAEEISTPELRPGMTIRVHERIKDGEKERTQVFQGIILALRGKNQVEKTVTVMKNSFGIRVEKIFPLASPLIEKIEVVKVARVRQSKLYYLREYGKRLKEQFVK